MSYKEIDKKEALNRYADGEKVYYRYFTNGGYAWIGGISLDHLRRNPERYKFFIEESSPTLFQRRKIEQDVYTYEEEDVKNALKEFIAWANDYDVDTKMESPYYKKAKEIFGEELLK